MNTIAYSRFLPAPSLRLRIAYYWLISVPMPRVDDRLELTLPDLHGEIIINFSGPYLRKTLGSSEFTTVKGSNVVGLRTHTAGAMRLDRNAALDLVGVKLFPGVLYSLTGLPAAESRDRVIEFRDLGSAQLERLESSLFDTTGPLERIRRLDEFFLVNLPNLCGRERWLLHVLGRWTHRPELTIREFSRELGLSPRTLERRFRDLLGSTPKATQRVLRFNKWLAAARSSDRVQQSGRSDAFYDQSHLARECRFFIDATPGQVVGQALPHTLNTFAA